MSIEIAPSILSANYACLKEDVDSVSNYVNWLHIDVMDGHFVKNLTIGPPVVKALRKISTLYFDCHLMIDNPEMFLEAFRDSGAQNVTIHYEVGKTDRLIKSIKDLGMHAGMALNPETDLEEVMEHLHLIDLLVIMTVHPGFGGQDFIEEASRKIRLAKDIRDKKGFKFKIEVDGGVNGDTAPHCIGLGADVLVSGSYIFSNADRKKAIDDLLKRPS